jgi:hypothetical protein
MNADSWQVGLLRRVSAATGAHTPTLETPLREKILGMQADVFGEHREDDFLSPKDQNRYSSNSRELAATNATVLFRFFAADETEVKAIETLRRRITCAQVR